MQNILTQVELPINISPEKIFEINARIIFDEDFRNKVVSDPTILSDYIGVPKEMLKNISLPPMVSTELRQILSNVSRKLVEQGIIKAEEFEYMISKAQNYMDIIAVAVAVLLAAIYVGAVWHVAAAVNYAALINVAATVIAWVWVAGPTS
jgi:hypothetical protein